MTATAPFRGFRKHIWLRQETVWGDGGTGSPIYVPLSDTQAEGGMENELYRAIPEVQGQQIRWQGIKGKPVELAINFMPVPETIATVFGMANTRNGTTFDLNSYGIYEASPTDARKWPGAKMRTLRISGQKGGEIHLETNWIAKDEVAGPTYATPDFGVLCAYLVQDVYVTWSGPTVAELGSFAVVLNTELEAGMYAADKRISALVAGITIAAGMASISLTDDDFSDAVRDGTTAAVTVVLGHPSVAETKTITMANCVMVSAKSTASNLAEEDSGQRLIWQAAMTGAGGAQISIA